MILDQREREDALDPTRSFIVQAPAGSGKTEILIQRFLTLLKFVEKPEEILAITFTKKAANEMRARVIKSLMFALNEPEPKADHAKKTWLLATDVLKRNDEKKWHLLENPNQLGIQTIDALCSYLTKQLPLLAQFGATPNIATQPHALYKQAAREVLLHIEEDYAWSKDISQLLLHLDNDFNKLENLLISLLSKRDQWLPYLHLGQGETTIRHELEAHLEAVIREQLNTISKLITKSQLNELLIYARYAASNLKLAGKESPVLACLDITEISDDATTASAQWLGLVNLLFTTENKWRRTLRINDGFPSATSTKNKEEKVLFNDYKKHCLELIGRFSDSEQFKDALTLIRFLPSATYTDEQWKALQSLLQVLKVARKQLRATFKEHGEIDFIENAQAALLALGDKEQSTDLTSALDYQIKHILIDEFQDTAFSQQTLLERLINSWNTNDGRTLFVVGDPMQSIYRFREAEVGLFLQMQAKGVGNVRLQPLSLKVNFRSEAQVVEWNNKTFDHVFPKVSDIASGAVHYSHSTPFSDKNDMTKITVNGFVDEDNRSQAVSISETIKQELAANPDDSIAILVRSRSHLAKIIPELKKENIPYRAVEIDPLANKQHIQDLISLTSAMLNAADRISWLSVLRAPWCGLSLADLLIIAEDRNKEIAEALSDESVLKKLSEDGLSRVNKLKSILFHKIDQRERDIMRSWIESTWLLIGGPACLNTASEHDDVKSYFNLLDVLSQSNLTINQKNIKDRINKLYAASGDQSANVTLMTIHSSKGLEFDTVVIPELNKKPPNNDKTLLQWLEMPLSSGKNALLLAPIHAVGAQSDKIYEYINRQQKVKLDYETDRLFYVATTRAKKKLILTFHLKKDQDGELKKPERQSFLEKLWPLINKELPDIIKETTEEVADKRSKRLVARLKSNWVNPIRAIADNNIFYRKNKDGFKLIDLTPKHIGVVTHSLLEQLGKLGVDWWHLNRAEMVKQLLIEEGCHCSQLELASDVVINNIKNAINDDKGKWILSPHEQAESEYSLNAVRNNEVCKYIIDRTFINNGIRWIIDFKTSRPDNQTNVDFIQQEKDKYRDQLETYGELFRELEDRPIRYGIYFPAIAGWCEWETEAIAA